MTCINCFRVRKGASLRSVARPKGGAPGSHRSEPFRKLPIDYVRFLLRFSMGKHDHCCVPHCTARRDDGMMRSFHHFPDDSERQKKWLLGIRRDEGAHFNVSRCTVVCSDHFLDSDLSKIPPRNAEDRQAVAGVRQSYRLKDTAVPFFSGKEKEKLQSVIAPPRSRSLCCTTCQKAGESGKPRASGDRTPSIRAGEDAGRNGHHEDEK